MKNFIFKTFAACLITLFTFTSSFAQEGIQQTALDGATSTRMLNTGDAVVLKQYFAAQGYREAGLNQEGTTRLSGNDTQGAFNLDITTLKMSNGRTSVEITVASVKRGLLNETSAWAQDGNGNEGSIYSVSSGRVTAKAAAKVNILDCFKNFDSSSCKDCFSCVKGCVQSNSKFWAKLICSVKCLGPCIKCGVNVFNLVACVIKAIKG
jgi:hypothetical protein